MNSPDISRLEGELYCQFESIDAQSDFTGAACIRLIGVARWNFSLRAFEEGIESFVIDLPRDDSLATQLVGFCDAPDDCPTCFEYFEQWFIVKFQPYVESGEPEPAYLYRCFGEANPIAISLRSFESIGGFKLPGFSPYVGRASPSSNSPWICSAFSVGQGMASLVYSSKSGYLIDAGAGTPIKRADYVGKTLNNELTDRVVGREITFVLSHGDEDHWRILRWDNSLRDAIREFIIPADRARIAFFDREIRSRVRELSAHVVLQLDSAAKLTLLRTSPSVKTSNNDGIVALFEGVKKVLLPGDCVYSAMQADSDPSVQALIAGVYDGIVVPHHGDEASSNLIPSPAQKATSTAYFSAGNHCGYKHPHAKSEQNHVKAGYISIVNKTPTAIIEHVF